MTGLAPDPVTRFVRARLAAAAPDGVPVLRDAVTAALASALQGPRPNVATGPHRDAGDPGLCGPGSASWQVLSDIAGLVAGVRALLLQTLHPRAMAGVADHSRYGEDPFGRLHRTSAWVAGTTFGSVPEALHLTAVVRGQHRRVTGTTPDGQPYAASDPDLLAWVSMTFTDSLLAADRAFAARPVDDATADRFVLEQSRLAALLDPRVPLPDLTADPTAAARLRRWEVDLPLLEDGLLPRDRAELRARLATYDPVLHRGAQADEALRFLARPGLPPYAMPAYRVLHAGALATLPGHVRGLLGRSWLRGPVAVGARRQAGALVTAMRLGTGRSPARQAAEQRLAAIATGPR